MQIPRRYWRNLDWPLIITVFVLSAIGMVVIYSASYSQLTAAGQNPFRYVQRQLLAFGLGLVAMIVIISIDYRAWKRWTNLIYFANLALLTVVSYW